MRMKLVITIASHAILFLGLAMLVPLAFSLYYGESDALPIALSIGFTIVPAGIFAMALHVPKDDLTRREGMLITSLIWVLAGLFGALPFFIAKTFGPMDFVNFINCFFESASGFTTTGASVMGATVKIESVSHGLLMWRSLIQWLGGMGIIVIAVAILPLLGVGGMQLFRAEASGHLHEKLRPRIKETAIALWGIYVAISALETILLMGGGMSLYEALCHTFTTMATGGFSTRDASITAFGSRYIEIIIMIFMFLGASSFSLHYIAWTRDIKAYFRDSQFRYYFAFTIGGIVIITLTLYFSGIYETMADSLRYGAFQSISIMTTTGYATADYDKWPYGIQLLLLLFMFMGGSAGSTTSAIKTIRVVLLCKYAYREIIKLIHPKIFASVKLGGRVIHKNALESISAFFIFYMLTFIVSSLIVAAEGLPGLTAMSAVAATLGNVGPGLGSVGPTGNYFALPILSKCVLIADMIVGRLELFTVLVILTPGFWKK
jgi:trk system potassium uptake protein TrkH